MGFNNKQSLGRKGFSLFPLLFFSSIILYSCATVIPPELKQEIKEEISLSLAKENPDAYQGKLVLWGGRIIKAENKKEGTLIEVLKLPLDITDRPKDVDTSEGRFLVLYPEYLDVAIYRPGREVTVIGRVDGTKTQPLGEIDYTYPLIRARKIHLWEGRAESIRVFHEYPFYPYQYGYPPYLWGYPYW